MLGASDGTTGGGTNRRFLFLFLFAGAAESADIICINFSLWIDCKGGTVEYENVQRQQGKDGVHLDLRQTKIRATARGNPVNDGFNSCEMYTTFLYFRNPHRYRRVDVSVRLSSVASCVGLITHHTHQRTLDKHLFDSLTHHLPRKTKDNNQRESLCVCVLVLNEIHKCHSSSSHSFVCNMPPHPVHCGNMAHF